MKIIQVFYIFLCTAGFLYQASLVFQEYFKYGVSASTTLTQANDYILPTISTCLEYLEVFDYSGYNSKYGTNITFNYTNRETMDDSSVKLQPLISVKDAYDYTPDADIICDYSNVRNSSSFQYHGYKNMCTKYFNIEKFIISTLVCYKISLKSDINIGNRNEEVNISSKNMYNIETTYFTPADHGSILTMFFNESLDLHFDYITNVMHPIDNYPWFEFSLTQLHARGHNVTTGSNILNYFSSKSSSISIHKLKYPYVTNCQGYRDKGYRDSFHCLSACINREVMTSFKKASLSYHFMKENIIDTKFLSNNDYSSITFNSKFYDILNTCHNICPMNDCEYTFTYTNTIGEAFSCPGVGVNLPDKSSFEINYTISVLFIDTFNFICSVLGVWFGFSFISINPFTGNNIFIMKRLKKQIFKKVSISVHSCDDLDRNSLRNNMNTTPSDSMINMLYRRIERDYSMQMKAINDIMKSNQKQINLLNRQISEFADKY